MTGRAIVLALVTAVIHFISCSGGPGQPRQLAEIPVPNNPSKFTFDIGYADQAGHDFIATAATAPTRALRSGRQADDVRPSRVTARRSSPGSRRTCLLENAL